MSRILDLLAIRESYRRSEIQHFGLIRGVANPFYTPTKFKPNGILPAAVNREGRDENEDVE